MSYRIKYALLLLPLALAACSSMPSGPNVMVLPGNGKTLEQFHTDDMFCRQYAAMQTGTSTNDVAMESGVKTAALGTALGAASGALIDGGHGAAGDGLAVGGQRLEIDVVHADEQGLGGIAPARMGGKDG